MNKGYPDWFTLHPGVNFSVVDWNDDKKQFVQMLPDADALIATQWYTAYYLPGIPLSKGIKYYLVQDYESQTITTPENADPTYILPSIKIVVSSWLSALLKERFGQGSKYIRNAIDTTVLYPDPSIRQQFPLEHIRIGMLCHTEPRKDIRSGLEAFRLIKQRYPSARLILFGTSEPQNIIYDNFYKNIIGDDVRRYYSSLDFFVSTSWQEGFGLPGLEAMACGVPLVTTNSGGIADYAVNGETAIIVPPRDPAAIAQALNHLIENRDLRHHLHQRGLAKSAEFSWNASVSAMENLLREMALNSPEERTAGNFDDSVSLDRAAPQKHLKVSIFSMDSKEHACGYYRILSPLGALQKEIELLWGIEFRDGTFQIIPDVAESSDIIVIQRFFPLSQTADFLDYLCTLGKPVIFEIDDLLTHLPPTNQCYNWGMQCAPYIYEFIRKCSAVTVSTVELKKQYSPYNERIYVLPNMLDSVLWHNTCPASLGAVVIGYAGTITHNTDLVLLENVLERIASWYGNRVAFTFMGCATERISKLPGFTFITFETTFESYAAILQKTSIDIMLVPLENNEFNLCKSNIKWLEYSACGIAGIYADLPPYNTSVKHGETGLLVGNNPEQWFQALSLLIDRPELRTTIARNARTEVLTHHTVLKGAHYWLDVYREILDRHATVLRGSPPAESAVKVSIIIPVYNQLFFTRQCLEGLFTTLPVSIPWEIIVVDNGSSDGTREYLHGLSNRLTIISNQENRGFAVACNLGAQAAKGTLVLFLNNDTVPKPGWIEALVTAFDNDKADICGARLLYPDGRCQHAGIAFDERGLGYHIFSGFPGNASPVIEQRWMQAVTGACLAVKRELFQELGGFDEGFRNGFEDVDFCLRAGEQGKRILYVPGSVVIHYAEQSSGRKDHDVPNMRRFFSRWDGKLRQDDTVLYDHFGLTNRREPDGRIVVASSVNRSVLVSIIIPLFNKAELTRSCLQALTQHTAQGMYELLLVDNCSNDSTTDLLREWESKATIIRNDHNRGFAAACNQGAHAAAGKYLLFLNNDTEVTAGWLEPLVATLERDPAVAAVGSKLLFPDGTIQHAGVMIVDDQASNDPLVGKHYFFRFPGNHPPANIPMRMQAVTAACILVRQTAFETVAGFDEGYWNGYEDLDLCFKLAGLGWKVIYQPGSIVIHHESQSGTERFRRVTDNIKRLHARWLGKIKPDLTILSDTSVLNGSGILEGLTGTYEYQDVNLEDPLQKERPMAKPVRFPLIPLVKQSASSILQKLSSSQQLRGVLKRYTTDD